MNRYWLRRLIVFAAFALSIPLVARFNSSPLDLEAPAKWTAAGDHALLGRSLPEFRMRELLHPKILRRSDVTLSGEYRTRASYANQVLVINFWATWCKPCIAEMEELADLQREYRGRVQVLAILHEDSPANAARFAKEGASMPILIDESDAFAQKLNVRGIPQTFVVDSKGTVRGWLMALAPAMVHAAIDSAIAQ